MDSEWPKRKEEKGAYYTIFKKLTVEDTQHWKNFWLQDLQNFLTSSPKAAILKDCYWRLMGYLMARFSFFFGCRCFAAGTVCNAHDATLIIGSFCPRFMTHDIKPTEFHATCCRDNIMSPHQNFFAKTGMSHEENCRCNMSPLHDPAIVQFYP